MSINSPTESRWITPLALIITLALCAPALFIQVGGHVSTHTMENVALVTSQETWLRWHEGESGAWLVTSNDEQPRVEKPPLLTWLNFVAWSDLKPPEGSIPGATPEQLTYRARLVSASMGLLMLIAIFWTGHTLGGRSTAVVAALAAGSMLFFERQARAASYDIHFVSWATLAVAGAMWAIGPREDAAQVSRARQIVGWSICGLAMACSVMSKNPLPFVIVLLPVAAAIALVGDGGESMLDPDGIKHGTPRKRRNRRRENIVGALAAICIALLPVLPWYVHVAFTYPEAARTLKREVTQPRSVYLPVYYYFGVFGLVLPWTVWLICGLAHPFALKDRSRRIVGLIALAWFVLIFVFFSIWSAKQQRYILPIVAPAALLCALVMREYQRRADQGQPDKLAIGLGNVIWLVVIGASVAFGLLLAMQEWVVQHTGEWFSDQRFTPVGWPAAIVLVAGPIGIAVVGWRWNGRKPMRAAAMLAIWAMVIMTVFWSVDQGESRRTSQVQRFKNEAERIARLVGGAPMRSLRITEKDQGSYKINEEFRFYFGRLIRHVGPKELGDFAKQSSGPAFVLAKPQKMYADALREAGYRRLDDHVMTDDDDVQTLWVRGME